MKEAHEPTNIKWENRDKTYTGQLKRKVIVFFVIMIMLLSAFYGIIILKQQTIKSCEKYPPNTDCESINN
jgi:hypothetical protein